MKKIIASFIVACILSLSFANGVLAATVYLTPKYEEIAQAFMKKVVNTKTQYADEGDYYDFLITLEASLKAYKAKNYSKITTRNLATRLLSDVANLRAQYEDWEDDVDSILSGLINGSRNPTVPPLMGPPSTTPVPLPPRTIPIPVTPATPVVIPPVSTPVITVPVTPTAPVVTPPVANPPRVVTPPAVTPPVVTPPASICTAGQVMINGKCIVPGPVWAYCYASKWCMSGLECSNNTCKTATVVKYEWVKRTTDCGCSFESEFSGTKTEYFDCKASDGSHANAVQCGERREPTALSCTMPKSCATYADLRFSYPASSVYEWEGLSMGEAKIQKCLGTNCSFVDIPKLDIGWSIEMSLDNRYYANLDNMAIINGKVYGYIWTKVDFLGGTALRNGDIVTRDMGDFFNKRELKVIGTLKDPSKYPSSNPVKTELRVEIKNRFDVKFSKNYDIYENGGARISIDMLGSEGYSHGGLYWYTGNCGITSSNPAIKPTIQYLDLNNRPFTPSAWSLGIWRFTIEGNIWDSPVGTKLDVTCTITDPKTNTTRTLTMSETRMTR